MGMTSENGKKSIMSTSIHAKVPVTEFSSEEGKLEFSGGKIYFVPLQHNLKQF